MSTPNSIIIDGVEYLPSALFQKPSGNRVVLVVDRGWIFAGDMTREDGRIHLSRALHVFGWRAVGFAAVVADPLKCKADLRPVSDVDVPAGAEVFCIPVADNWGLK